MFPRSLAKLRQKRLRLPLSSPFRSEERRRYSFFGVFFNRKRAQEFSALLKRPFRADCAQSFSFFRFLQQDRLSPRTMKQLTPPSCPSFDRRGGAQKQRKRNVKRSKPNTEFTSWGNYWQNRIYELERKKFFTSDRITSPTLRRLDGF